MMPRAVLRPGQMAWLAEIGLDTHWLATRPLPEADRVADAVADTPAQPDPVPARVAPAAVPDPSPRAPVGSPAPGLVRARAPAGLAVPSATPAIPPADCADLAALAAAVSACSQCVRHTQRALAVPGEGLVQRPFYLIVGEQPGIEDDTQGLPFRGNQGQLLTAMLAAVRLPHRESVYLTHVVKCRAVSGREPTAEEIAACVPWLRRQIALLQPRWILALGRVAAQAVIGTERDLDGLRGGPHQHVPDQGEPIPVWVTHQPSSLLVRSAWKAEAWRDLAGLAQAVQA